MTARRRRSSNSCNASPTSAAAISRSSCFGTRKPARRKSWSHRTMIARAKTYRLDITQTVPPTPGQPDKAPMVIPLALGLVGKDGGDLPLMLDGRPLDRGVIELTEPSRSFVFTGIAEPPIPSAQPRFFGAGQTHAADRSRRSAFPRRTRSRSVQSLAGGADAGDGAFDGECRGAAQRSGGARGRRS